MTKDKKIVEIKINHRNRAYKKLDKYGMYESLFERWGEKQFYVAIEEMSELQKELCKMLRKGDLSNLEQIKEEIVDVGIMLEQLICIFKLSLRELDEIKEHKLQRTKAILY